MGFRHESIAAGIEAIQKIGKEKGIGVDTSENAAHFTEENLQKYSAIVFLNTTGDVLDYRQQAAFERYIQAGGGFVGVHSATDTEYEWKWYGKLVGAYFNGHPSNPNVRKGLLKKSALRHPATETLPENWERTDEWYNFKNINEKIKVLISIDEKSYEGGTNGEHHPMTWYQDFDGGRAFYTAFGHTSETYKEPLFLNLLWEGISYAIGENKKPDFRKAASVMPPEENRFSKTVLATNFDEPMQFSFLPNRDLLIIERKGTVKYYSIRTGEVRIINRLEVHTEHEDGLLGIAVDPGFEENHWVYLFYSPVGEVSKQNVSRFEFINGQLGLSTEKIVLEIPVQRESCCHSAGALLFDKKGNLFISVGDNTNPFASNGYAPLDERKGRSPWDAQKSSGNTRDLRGKILRIKPLPDGTYSIPEGNLFPKDGSKGRPEIYVMGCRNPFRFSIDERTGYLYWGDVGPDANKDTIGRGPRGYDEINQAKKPGFFGWPYFIADNKAYHFYDFEKNQSGKVFSSLRPLNHSPNNTGTMLLPPARGAFIWYPYANSAEFPLVKTGSRNAMAGPVYDKDDKVALPGEFPEYYNGKLFIYDWMRCWILIATMDQQGDLLAIEPFAPQLEFNNPIDMKFGSDHSLYVLEYGTNWFKANADARLSRIDYQQGNRAPLAKISADQIAGTAPLKVRFSAKKSSDPDRDPLKYRWKFTSAYAFESYEKEPTFTFTEEGIYEPYLVVEDAYGNISTAQTKVTVGNFSPEITWKLDNANQSFYWEAKGLNYEVQVNDEEDGSTVRGGIDEKEVHLTINYLPEGMDKSLIAQGHEAFLNFNLGEQLIGKYNCKSCHSKEENAVGPAYKRVAKTYKNDPLAMQKLSARIKNGGKGQWGERVMPAHPQITTEEMQSILTYILGLDEDEKTIRKLPLRGSYLHGLKATEKGMYFLSATYTDKGKAKLPGLVVTNSLQLRNPKIEAENFDEASAALQVRNLPENDGKMLINCRHQTYLLFRKLDLTGVKAISCRYLNQEDYQGGGRLEIRSGSVKGKLIGSAEIPAKGKEKWQQLTVSLNKTEGFQNVYIVFQHPANINQNLLAPDWFYFSH